MNSKGLLHFDAHFWNILTDGECLFFSDFGLAISSQFDLAETERDFLKKHRFYDQCYIAYYLAKYLLMECLGEEHWESVLKEHDKEKTLRKLPLYISEIIARNYNFLIVMNEFFDTIRVNPKTTSYPADIIDRLFVSSG